MGETEEVRKILEKEAIDVVMHFAAFAYAGESMTDPLRCYENNVAKTIRLLQATRRAKVHQIRLFLDLRDVWHS